MWFGSLVDFKATRVGHIMHSLEHIKNALLCYTCADLWPRVHKFASKHTPITCADAQTTNATKYQQQRNHQVDSRFIGENHTEKNVETHRATDKWKHGNFIHIDRRVEQAVYREREREYCTARVRRCAQDGLKSNRKYGEEEYYLLAIISFMQMRP